MPGRSVPKITMAVRDDIAISPSVALRSRQLPERRQHFIGVAGRLHLLEHAGDPSLLINDERGAEDAHVLPAIHRLLAPDTVRPGYRMAFIGQQRERET